MKKLQKHQRKNGYDYELFKRCDNVAIYKQMENYQQENEFIVAYEVFQVKIRKDKTIKGSFIEGGEVFPSNEDFGKHAWCYSTFNSTNNEKALENANNKYNLLKKD